MPLVQFIHITAAYSNAFELIDATTRSQLPGYLANHTYENFYYLGHGNDSHISAYNGAASAISKDQIANALGNVPLSMNYGSPVVARGLAIGLPPIAVQPTINPAIQHAALHPYRFAWVDACRTGRGNFCESFGIPALTVSTNFFAAAGVESRAYLGFTEVTQFDDSNSSSDPNGWPNRSIMMATFLDAWLSNASDLNTIVQNAKNAFGTPGYKMDPSAIIYGAYDLKRFTFTRPQ